MNSTVIDTSSDEHKKLMLKTALRLAKHFKIIPVHTIRNGACTCGDKGCEDSAGKHPVDTGWQSRATSGKKQIELWYTGSRAGYNIGLIMGNGVVAIDIDDKPNANPPKYGSKKFARLEERLGRLPKRQCHSQTTSSGGKHYLYRTKNEFTRHIELDENHALFGIDIISNGGYMIVAAPSVTLNGQYDAHSTFGNNIPQLPQVWEDYLLKEVKQVEDEKAVNAKKNHANNSTKNYEAYLNSLPATHYDADDERIQEIGNALSYIPASGPPTKSGWFSIIGALRLECNCQRMFELAQNWSAATGQGGQCDGYRGRDHFCEEWQNAIADSMTSGAAHIQTVFKWAYEYGMTDPMIPANGSDGKTIFNRATVADVPATDKPIVDEVAPVEERPEPTGDELTAYKMLSERLPYPETENTGLIKLIVDYLSITNLRVDPHAAQLAARFVVTVLAGSRYQITRCLPTTINMMLLYINKSGHGKNMLDSGVQKLLDKINNHIYQIHGVHWIAPPLATVKSAAYFWRSLGAGITRAKEGVPAYDRVTDRVYPERYAILNEYGQNHAKTTIAGGGAGIDHGLNTARIIAWDNGSFSGQDSAGAVIGGIAHPIYSQLGTSQYETFIETLSSTDLHGYLARNVLVWPVNQNTVENTEMQIMQWKTKANELLEKIFDAALKMFAVGFESREVFEKVIHTSRGFAPKQPDPIEIHLTVKQIERLQHLHEQYAVKGRFVEIMDQHKADSIWQRWRHLVKKQVMPLAISDSHDSKGPIIVTDEQLEIAIAEITSSCATLSFIVSHDMFTDDYDAVRKRLEQKVFKKDSSGCFVYNADNPLRSSILFKDGAATFGKNPQYKHEAINHAKILGATGFVEFESTTYRGLDGFKIWPLREQ